MEWKDVVAGFSQYLRIERSYAHNTCLAYIRDIEEFGVLFHEARGKWPDLSRITVYELRSFLAALHGKNQARSLARKLSSLRRLFGYLQKKGLVAQNPAKIVKNPRLKKRLPRALDVDATFAVVEAPSVQAKGRFEKRDRAILEMIYGAGLRVSECCGLDLIDVERVGADGALLRVRKGKGGKVRLVPIGEQALAALAAYQTAERNKLAERATKEVDAMFLNNRGGRISVRLVQRMVEKHAELLGIPATPHVLRHCYATHLLDGGADLRSIQELLGHASLASTQVYTKVSLDHLMSTYDAAHPHARGIPRK